MSKPIDITDKVAFGLNNDECLPLKKCACGKEFDWWEFILGMDSDPGYPKECPNCGRKMWFSVKIRVYEEGEK